MALALASGQALQVPILNLAATTLSSSSSPPIVILILILILTLALALALTLTPSSPAPASPRTPRANHPQRLPRAKNRSLRHTAVFDRL
ncbi:hypothetical protein K504DRAFT_499198 [Pleomassaria siparia CBS 279.74]|uniref:Uncharacterized protein n=1 Tax=Pleomassaria siparia CBS 279.74 TaxID=1314801 RepID=A0A6G1KHR0_9PLEO|nr:hypothetical protein K504DRAFT_499198 [Pleomassaria siparia CBS 279.74]